jgi:hypothetical protein
VVVVSISGTEGVGSNLGQVVCLTKYACFAEKRRLNILYVYCLCEKEKKNIFDN